MSLSDKIKVRTHYTRSVNLERDAASAAILGSYIPTSRALRTIDRLVSTVHDDQAPRAWSLIGPYGSGKSSYALFLSHLLGSKSDNDAQQARSILASADADLASRIESNVDGGYLRVLVTGSPEPMTRRLASSIATVSKSFFDGRPGANPKAVKRWLELANEDDIEVSEFLKALEQLQISLVKAGVQGLMLVIDELGKFLEYEARHYGANDIYLLQALAEKACSAGSFKLFLFALLHQSFEQYAKGLGESLKNEWGKVQGRFEEVPFLESAEQILRVLNAAFVQDLKRQERISLESQIREIAEALDQCDVLPGVLSKTEATKLFLGCYPLHPITSFMLPSLCQKIAQNERTLFSYLGSHEQHGLGEVLKRLAPGEFVMPHHVYDYFVTNQSSVAGDYVVHRKWVEVQTAIERVGDVSPGSLEMLKTIGLFNIMGSRGGLKPSREILNLVGQSKAAVTKSLKQLESKSVVNFRKFSSEYRVWQGSDFDLEEALGSELSNLGNFPLAEELNKGQQLAPIVARKYSIETGALRYFQPVFVDAKNYLKLPQKEDDPRIVFYLALDESDKKQFKRLQEYFSSNDILVSCATSAQLQEAVAESIALRRIASTAQQLRTDPVAKRELDDRLFSAEKVERDLVSSFLEMPQLHEWRFQGKDLKVPSKRSLQGELSAALKKIYPKTPIVHNELINRDRPSVQANAARNKLLAAMQASPEQPDLGMQKFPAEKAIYRAVLKETGIHRYPEDGLDDCKFEVPVKNRTNIHFVWKEIDRFLDTTENEARSFVDLNATLMAPPFGVKAGLLPVLYFAAFQVYQGELALYENRRYRPSFTEDMIERFIKRPTDFTVQRFRISGLRASIFDQYSKVIHGDTKKRTLLELAKPLAAFMGGLPEYTQKTRRGLSDSAQSVRSAFNLSKSPERLLFEELPNALGFGDLSAVNQHDLEEFSQRLIEVLRELRDAHKKLLSRQRSLLAQALNRDVDISLEELREQVKQWSGLDAYTVDAKDLGGFISRLTKVKGTDEDWFENVLMFLGHKPTSKWLDADQDAAEYRLNDFARKIVDLERIRLLAHDRGAAAIGDIDFYLLRSVKKGGDISDQVVAVDEKTVKRVRSIEDEVKESLSKLGSKELRLAVIARLVDEFLKGFEAEVEQGVSEKIKTFDVIPGGKKDG